MSLNEEARLKKEQAAAKAAEYRQKQIVAYSKKRPDRPLYDKVCKVCRKEFRGGIVQDRCGSKCGWATQMLGEAIASGDKFVCYECKTINTSPPGRRYKYCLACFNLRQSRIGG